MDPSMLIGFLIRDEDDWDLWKSSVKHVQGEGYNQRCTSRSCLWAWDPAGQEPSTSVETLSDDDSDTTAGDRCLGNSVRDGKELGWVLAFWVSCVGSKGSSISQRHTQNIVLLVPWGRGYAWYPRASVQL